MKGIKFYTSIFLGRTMERFLRSVIYWKADNYTSTLVAFVMLPTLFRLHCE